MLLTSLTYLLVCFYVLTFSIVFHNAQNFQRVVLRTYPKVRTIEFVFGFGNAKNLLLLLKSYLSEFDILNFSAIFFGQFPVIAFETYALAFSFLFTDRFFQFNFFKISFERIS